jgi:hypothetical protein
VEKMIVGRTIWADKKNRRSTEPSRMFKRGRIDRWRRTVRAFRKSSES